MLKSFISLSILVFLLPADARSVQKRQANVTSGTTCPNGMSQNIQSIFLSTLAQGKQWDCNMESSAAQRASACSLDNSGAGSGSFKFSISTADNSANSDPSALLQAQLSSLAIASRNAQAQGVQSGNSVTGQQQPTLLTSTSIGCAYSSCTNRIDVVCLFNANGNPTNPMAPQTNNGNFNNFNNNNNNANQPNGGFVPNSNVPNNNGMNNNGFNPNPNQNQNGGFAPNSNIPNNNNFNPNNNNNGLNPNQNTNQNGGFVPNNANGMNTNGDVPQQPNSNSINPQGGMLPVQPQQPSINNGSTFFSNGGASSSPSAGQSTSPAQQQ